MSSITTVRLHVTTRATATGNQCLDISNMLGPGGCELMLGTLRDLKDRKSPLAGIEGGFHWQQAGEHGEHFTLEVAHELPEGVQGLTIHLRLHGSLAEIRHEARYQVTQTQTSARASGPSPVMQAQIQRTVNRSVNRLLALTVAGQLQQRVTQKLSQTVRHRVQNAVTMRLRNMNTIQTVARVRAGVER